MNFLYASRIESLFAWTLWYTLVVTWHWTVTYFVTWLGLPNPVDYINYGLYCRMSTEKTTCQLLSNPYTTLFSKPEAWLVNENFRRESKRTRLGEGAWSTGADFIWRYLNNGYRYDSKISQLLPVWTEKLSKKYWVKTVTKYSGTPTNTEFRSKINKYEK